MFSSLLNFYDFIGALISIIFPIVIFGGSIILVIIKIIERKKEKKKEKKEFENYKDY